MVRWQETGTPKARVKRIGRTRRASAGDKHDERRKVCVLIAQAIARPRAETGPSRLLMPRLQERDRWIVINSLRVHRADEAKLIHDFCGVRHELAHPCATFSVL